MSSPGAILSVQRRAFSRGFLLRVSVFLRHPVSSADRLINQLLDHLIQRRILLFAGSVLMNRTTPRRSIKNVIGMLVMA